MVHCAVCASNAQHVFAQTARVAKIFSAFSRRDRGFRKNSARHRASNAHALWHVWRDGAMRDRTERRNATTCNAMQHLFFASGARREGREGCGIDARGMLQRELRRTAPHGAAIFFGSMYLTQR